MIKCTIGAVLAFALVSLSAQAPEPISDAALRPLVAAALTAGAGNPDKVIEALDRSVKARWGDFEKGLVPLPSLLLLEQTGAVVVPPYLKYRNDLKTKLRAFESTADLTFVGDEVLVQIAPPRLDATDIVKVVVQRDGQLIAPLRSDLSPESFSNRFGGRVLLNAGTVVFPMAAFAPGATVRIVLVPRTGENLTTTLDNKRLGRFK